MTVLRLAAVLAAAGLASGCVNLSRSAPVAALPAEAARDGRVDEVVLTKAPETVSPEFAALFRERVKAKLDGCATGARPLRLEASVERLTRTNPVVTAVVAGANVLRGTARLVDVGTGQVVGQYRIGSTVVGGRIAVIRMAQAEEQMSDAFGQELCEQAFAAGKGRAPAAAPEPQPTPAPEPGPQPAPESPPLPAPGR
jgi:hypothetical protein